MTSENVEPIDGLDTPAMVTSGIIAAIGTFALIVALQVVYLRFEATEREKNLSGASQTSATSLLAEQRSRINRYGWIDRQKDVVAIPVELAITLTVRELRSSSLTDQNIVEAPPADGAVDELQ